MVKIKHPNKLCNAFYIPQGGQGELSDGLGSLQINWNPERGHMMAKERYFLDDRDNSQNLYSQTSIAQPTQNQGDMIKMLVKIRTINDQII